MAFQDYHRGVLPRNLSEEEENEYHLKTNLSINPRLRVNRMDVVPLGPHKYTSVLKLPENPPSYLDGTPSFPAHMDLYRYNPPVSMAVSFKNTQRAWEAYSCGMAELECEFKIACPPPSIESKLLISITALEQLAKNPNGYISSLLPETDMYSWKRVLQTPLPNWSDPRAHTEALCALYDAKWATHQRQNPGHWPSHYYLKKGRVEAARAIAWSLEQMKRAATTMSLATDVFFDRLDYLATEDPVHITRHIQQRSSILRQFATSANPPINHSIVL